MVVDRNLELQLQAIGGSHVTLDGLAVHAYRRT